MSDTIPVTDLKQLDPHIIPVDNITNPNVVQPFHHDENKAQILTNHLNGASPSTSQVSDSLVLNVGTIESSPESKLSTSNEENNRELDDRDQENASVLVIILQCETKPCDNNIANLKWVFSNPYFTVQVCAVDHPPNIPISKVLSQAQYLENYCMRKALTYAAEGPYVIDSNGMVEPHFWWSKIPCIIVKDSSVSNITPIGNTKFDHGAIEDNIIGGMKRRIQVALDRAQQADLFFLCKWNDACNKYVDVNSVNSLDHGSTLKWSVQPTSTQAIMYTPSSRDYIKEALISSTITLSDLLNSNISQGRLLATVFVPNIIDFDIDLATSNEDYAKLSECAPITTTTTQSSTTASYIWLAIIIFLVILVAWALIQLSPQYINTPDST